MRTDDVWRVAVEAILLRYTSQRRASFALQSLFMLYPGPEYLSRADYHAVERILRCGHPKPARQLIRFSAAWLSSQLLSDLPGVNTSVVAAVEAHYAQIATK